MSEPVDRFYPAWRFHPTLPWKTVASAAEDAALDKDWVDTPAKLPGSSLPPDRPAAAKPAPPPAEPPPVPDLEPDPPPKKSHHKKPVE